jgi:hypothetical protein
MHKTERMGARRWLLTSMPQMMSLSHVPSPGSRPRAGSLPVALTVTVQLEFDFQLSNILNNFCLDFEPKPHLLIL